jgi:hypothetical protein
MKLVKHVGIGVLSLVLGVPAVMFAQDEPKRDEPRPEPKAQDEAKPPKQEQPKPESKQDEMKPPKEAKPSKQEDAKPVPGQQEEGNQKAPKQAMKSGHIPDNKFHANFGRSHTVVINQPVIVEGQPRFQYGGYWFVISDPWPGDWAYTDQCYIDYVDGGYFLFDLLHPGIRIALIVVD